MTRFLRLPLLVFLISVTLTGCSTFSYYAQAIDGHLTLMSKRRPISRVGDDPQLDAATRGQLIKALAIRDFASQHLQLPDNDSYRSYAAVDGDAVVWSLVAAEALSVEPLQWCYPIIGCASYRGYFSYGDALGEARALRAEGYDVAVEQVPAYSTLGWFDDPLPTNILHWPDWRLAGLIFHELAHQRLYVTGDSAFNEAFASHVERFGIKHWLDIRQGPKALESWRLTAERERQFTGLLLQTRARLERLYAQDLRREEKLRRKAETFRRLYEDYRTLKAAWPVGAGYDHWFESEPNNARLASVATYEAWVPVFDRLLELSNGELEPFYRACEALARLPLAQRRLRMEALRLNRAESGAAPKTVITTSGRTGSQHVRQHALD